MLVTVLLIIEALFSIFGVVVIFCGLVSRKDDAWKLGIVILITGVILGMITWIVMNRDNNTNEVLPESNEATPTPYKDEDTSDYNYNYTLPMIMLWEYVTN